MPRYGAVGGRISIGGIEVTATGGDSVGGNSHHAACYAEGAGNIAFIFGLRILTMTRYDGPRRTQGTGANYLAGWVSPVQRETALTGGNTSGPSQADGARDRVVLRPPPQCCCQPKSSCLQSHHHTLTVRNRAQQCKVEDRC